METCSLVFPIRGDIKQHSFYVNAKYSSINRQQVKFDNHSPWKQTNLLQSLQQKIHLLFIHDNMGEIPGIISLVKWQIQANDKQIKHQA